MEFIKKIKYPLAYQNLFFKKTSPWESDDNTIIFEFDDIKAFYYINIDDYNKNERNYELVCSVHHKDQNYFIEMHASCNYKGFEGNGGEGYLNITKYANIFLKDMVKLHHNPYAIYTALKNNGYDLEEYKTYIYNKMTIFFKTSEDNNEIIEEDMEIFY